MQAVDNEIYYLIFFTILLMVILYRAFGTRHGQERKRDRYKEIQQSSDDVQNILGQIKKIVEEEKSRKQ